MHKLSCDCCNAKLTFISFVRQFLHYKSHDDKIYFYFVCDNCNKENIITKEKFKDYLYRIVVIEFLLMVIISPITFLVLAISGVNVLHIPYNRTFIVWVLAIILQAPIYLIARGFNSQVQQVD